MLDGQRMQSQVEQTKRRSRWKTVARFLIGTIVVVAVVVASRQFRGASKTHGQPHSIGQLSVPQFSVPGGVFTNNVSVRLTAAASPSAVIRFTVDGSEPTTSSRKYSGPITIAGSTLLQAKVYEGRSTFSATVSQSYIRLSPELES